MLAVKQVVEFSARMLQGMAVIAKRDTVADIKSHIRVIGPRLDVMGTQSATPLTATMLTGISIPLEHCSAPNLVFIRMAQNLSGGCDTTFPSRMVRSTQSVRFYLRAQMDKMIFCPGFTQSAGVPHKCFTQPRSRFCRPFSPLVIRWLAKIGMIFLNAPALMTFCFQSIKACCVFPKCVTEFPLFALVAPLFARFEVGGIFLNRKTSTLRCQFQSASFCLCHINRLSMGLAHYIILPQQAGTYKNLDRIIKSKTQATIFDLIAEEAEVAVQSLSPVLFDATEEELDLIAMFNAGSSLPLETMTYEEALERAGIHLTDAGWIKAESEAIA